VTFLVSNPYTLLDLDGFSTFWLAYLGTGEVGAGYIATSFEIWSEKLVSLIRTFSWSFLPFTLICLVAMFWALVKGNDRIRVLVLYVAIVIVLALATGKLGRYVLFIQPVTCLLVGWLLFGNRATEDKSNSSGRTLIWLFGLAVLVPLAFSTVTNATGLVRHKFNNSIYRDNLACISNLKITEGASLGLYEYPSPRQYPAFPFLNTEITLLDQEDNKSGSDLILLRESGSDESRWAKDSRAADYEYVCGLRGSFHPMEKYGNQKARFFRAKNSK
jgi:hypothetical protein